MILIIFLFNWLYWLKGRDCNSISCCPAYRRGSSKKQTLFRKIFLDWNRYFIIIRLFDSWIRYAVLYFGILIDIIVPLLGRKCLEKVPTNTAHLLERFGLFSIILFGEALVSTLVVIQPKQGNWDSISFAIISFILIISMWWQYFDNMEKKLDKSRQTSGQIIIYGHLFILMSLSMVAHPLDYYFYMRSIILLSYILFWFCIALFPVNYNCFHQYRFEQHRLNIYHLCLF